MFRAEGDIRRAPGPETTDTIAMDEDNDKSDNGALLEALQRLESMATPGLLQNIAAASEGSDLLPLREALQELEQRWTTAKTAAVFSSPALSWLSHTGGLSPSTILSVCERQRWVG